MWMLNVDPTLPRYGTDLIQDRFSSTINTVALVTHLALCYLIDKHREENCSDYFGYCRKSAEAVF